MAFNLLSLELNEHIAMFLETDREVCDFRLICHATNWAIETYRCGVWRDRFAKRYDMPEKNGGQEIMMIYKIRSKLLRKGARFLRGQQPREIGCMNVLRGLIVESYANLPAGRKAKHPSNNLEAIQRFVQRFGLCTKSSLHLADKDNVNPLLQILRLVLTHLELNIPLARARPALAFADSQFAVYTHPDSSRMFDTSFGTFDRNLLLHTANFFKFHLTQKGENTLYELFSQLKTHEKPKAWNSKLVQESGVKKLGKHWKGTYAYLHNLPDVDLIRRSVPGQTSSFFIDSIDHHDGFQTLQLDFEPQNNRARWPGIFESHLNAMPPGPLCHLLDLASSETNNNNNNNKGRNEQTPLSPPETPRVKRTDIVDELPVPQTNGKKPRTRPSSSTTVPPKRGVHYQQFSGCGNDAEPFLCKGILHPLPPQEEIPGWYRISMMKYFDPLSPGAAWAHPFPSPPSSSSSSEGENNDDDDDENNNNTYGSMYEIADDAQVNAGCWAYEGVVLPGGMIMLGRWWSPVDDEGKRCMGPFVFWNVDED